MAHHDSMKRCRCLLAVAFSLGLTSCGSANHKPPTIAVVGGAAVAASSSAPSYCHTLTSSHALVGLSAALTELAQNPNSTAARQQIGQAASAARTATGQAHGAQVTALGGLARALTALQDSGLAAATQFNATLHAAGAALRSSCGFPLG